MKIIESIIKKKNGDIDIIFSDKEIIHTNIETFTDYFLYEKKEIDEAVFQEILHKDRILKYKKSMCKLFNRRNYSEKQIRNKLIETDLSSLEIEEIIDYLKDIRILNDEVYRQEIIEMSNQKCCGYSKIIELLGEAGLDSNYKYDEKLEKLKIKKVMPSLIKKYSYHNFQKMKDSIVHNLYYLGFNSDNIEYGLSTLNRVDFVENDLSKLRQDYLKLKMNLIKNGDEINTSKIINKLRLKGYQYDDIKKIIEQGD